MGMENPIFLPKPSTHRKNIFFEIFKKLKTSDFTTNQKPNPQFNYLTVKNLRIYGKVSHFSKFEADKWEMKIFLPFLDHHGFLEFSPKNLLNSGTPTTLTSTSSKLSHTELEFSSKNLHNSDFQQTPILLDLEKRTIDNNREDLGSSPKNPSRQLIGPLSSGLWVNEKTEDLGSSTKNPYRLQPSGPPSSGPNLSQLPLRTSPDVHRHQYRTSAMTSDVIPDVSALMETTLPSTVISTGDPTAGWSDLNLSYAANPTKSSLRFSPHDALTTSDSKNQVQNPNGGKTSTDNKKKYPPISPKTYPLKKWWLKRFCKDIRVHNLNFLSRFFSPNFDDNTVLAEDPDYEPTHDFDYEGCDPEVLPIYEDTLINSDNFYSAYDSEDRPTVKYAPAAQDNWNTIYEYDSDEDLSIYDVDPPNRFDPFHEGGTCLGYDPGPCSPRPLSQGQPTTEGLYLAIQQADCYMRSMGHKSSSPSFLPGHELDVPTLARPPPMTSDPRYEYLWDYASATTCESSWDSSGALSCTAEATCCADSESHPSSDFSANPTDPPYTPMNSLTDENTLSLELRDDGLLPTPLMTTECSTLLPTLRMSAPRRPKTTMVDPTKRPWLTPPLPFNLAWRGWVLSKTNDEAQTLKTNRPFCRLLSECE